MVSGESDAQAIAAVPQCGGFLLLWQPVCPGRHPEAVQHQAENPKFR